MHKKFLINDCVFCTGALRLAIPTIVLVFVMIGFTSSWVAAFFFFMVALTAFIISSVLSMVGRGHK